MKLDEYFEKLGLALVNSEARQEDAEALLQKVRNALEARNVGELSTDALLDAYVQLLTIQREEIRWQGNCYTSQFIETEKAEEREKEKADESSKSHNRYYSQLGVDPLSLLVGSDLIPIVAPEQGGPLIAKITKLRKKLINGLGFVLPTVRVMDSLNIPLDGYQILMRGNVMASGTIYPERVMIPSFLFDDLQETLPADAILEPNPFCKGRQVVWAHPDSLSSALKSMVLTPEEVICLHLKETVIQQADVMMSHTETAKLMALVEHSDARLIRELIPARLPVNTIRQIFAALLRERVSLRDVLYVFERLNAHSYDYKEPMQLLERLRCDLARHICTDIADNKGRLYAIVLSTETEKAILKGQSPPVELDGIPVSALQRYPKLDSKRPVIIASAEARLAVFQTLVPLLPDIAVLSLNEIAPDITVVPMN